MTERLLTIQDVAEHLEPPARLVRQFIASGLLAAYELEPRVLRIRPGEYDAFLHRHPWLTAAIDNPLAAPIASPPPASARRRRTRT
jgi:hypothetical protein